MSHDTMNTASLAVTPGSGRGVACDCCTRPWTFGKMHYRGVTVCLAQECKDALVRFVKEMEEEEAIK